MDTDKLFCAYAWLMRVLMFIAGYCICGSPHRVAGRVLTNTDKDDNNNVMKDIDMTEVSPKISQKLSLLLSRKIAAIPPEVSLQINKPGREHVRYGVTVPLVPEMTVLNGLVAAVKSNRDSYNPFNVQLLWDDNLDCYTIHKALGTQNSSTKRWMIKVIDLYRQTVYKSQCLPRRKVILRPFYRVRIAYQPFKQ